MSGFKRIVIHWTGGTYTPNDTDKKAYHFIIDGNGEVIEGVHSPLDNLNCKDGNYARHCGGGNTGSIGVAIASMWNPRDYPIRRIQIERACKLCAELCVKYGIRITTTSIVTHSEFGEAHPSSTSRGKTDIDCLPCVAIQGRTNVGRWIRNKVQWYRSKM